MRDDKMEEKRGNIEVLELFKAHAVIPKAHYSVGLRDKFHEWPPALPLSSGYVEKNVLYLPDQFREQIAPEKPGFILLTETNPLKNFQQKLSLDEKAYPEWFIHYNRASSNIPSRPLKIFSNENTIHFELFEVQRIDGKYYVFFDYERNAFQLGRPERANHYLVELEEDHPFIYRVNGGGISEQGRVQERVFFEFAYIFRFYRNIRQIEFLAPSQLKELEEVPECEKVIDERKATY